MNRAVSIRVGIGRLRIAVMAKIGFAESRRSEWVRFHGEKAGAVEMEGRGADDGRFA
jgi:hypothetical protein